MKTDSQNQGYCVLDHKWKVARQHRIDLWLEGCQSPNVAESSTAVFLVPESTGGFGNGFDVKPPGQQGFQYVGADDGFHASGDSSPQLTIPANTNTMEIDGLLVEDEVAFLSDLFELPFDQSMAITQPKLAEALLQWLNEVDGLTAHMPSDYVAGGKLEDVRWRIMIADRIVTGEGVNRPAPPELGELVKKFKAQVAFCVANPWLFDTPLGAEMQHMVYQMVFTAPLSRNQPPADRSPILNPNPTTPPPAKFANIYGGSGVAAVLISGYLWRRLIRPLIRRGPRSLHYSTGR